MYCIETIDSQSSWVIGNRSTELAITQIGAHMAPVTFYRDTPRPIQPYYISTWQGKPHPFPEGASEAVLRGDFFCLPFGHNPCGNAHGRTAGERWELVSVADENGVQSLSIQMENALIGGTATRSFHLCEGENVVYDLTAITGLKGSYPLGHHAVLRCSARGGRLLISAAGPFRGLTFPGLFADNRERQSLAQGADFSSLEHVPALADGQGPIDCSVYPRERRLSDFMQISAEPEIRPAWTTVVNAEERYLWFSIRNPSLLPSTLFWMECGGREAAPWEGRTELLGVEDVCSYFNFGAERSAARNPFSQRGVKTSISLRGDQVLMIPYVQGVVDVPEGFRRVRTCDFDEHAIHFTDETGNDVSAAVQTGFVFSGVLADGHARARSA
jgi:hypothetical protein